MRTIIFATLATFIVSAPLAVSVKAEETTIIKKDDGVDRSKTVIKKDGDLGRSKTVIKKDGPVEEKKVIIHKDD